MKRILLAGLFTLVLAPFTAKGDITVKLPAGAADSISYYCTPIVKMAKATSRSEYGTVNAKLPVKDNSVILPIGDDKGGYSYTVFVGPRQINLYAVPGDAIVAEVTSANPFQFTVSGSELVDQKNQIEKIKEPYMAQISELSKAEKRDQEKIQATINEYLAALKEFVDENPTSPAVCFALMSLDGEDFMNAFEKLGERPKTSPIYPLLEKRKVAVQKSIEKERKLKEMQSGNVDAPSFTLKDLDGKDVSLSDFKGKWVILDFWGSWCGWCIKGFPELKEIYAKHKDNVVIIGIDNSDTDEAWRKAVAKHELPWVNLYNPKESSLAAEYAVSGFPTKIIVNPQGKIANITVGHTPDYTKTVEETMAK